MNWRARVGGPKRTPKMWPDVYRSRPQKGPSAGTPRIGPGALLGPARPWETLNLTTVVEFPHQERAGQKADAEIRDLGPIFGVPLGGPPGACFMTFWGLKMGLLFEALELPRGAQKQKGRSRGPSKSGLGPNPRTGAKFKVNLSTVLQMREKCS